MIDLKLLHQALTLTRYRNFGRAAEALDMSQPALSRSISGLERSLGVALFSRARHGVEPTAFGERLLTRGERLLGDCAEIERELALMQGLHPGVLRIGAGPYPAEMSVGRALGRLAARHPDLRVELRVEGWRPIIDALLAAQIDLAVVESSVVAQDPRVQTDALPRHPGVFFCRAGHPLLGGPEPSLEQILAYPFVSTPLPARVAQTFYRLAKTGAIDPQTGDYLPPIRVDSVCVARAIAASSDAVALAPRALIADDLGCGRLVALPFKATWLQTHYGFTHLRDRALSPACLAFVEQVNAVEAEMMETGDRPRSG